VPAAEPRLDVRSQGSGFAASNVLLILADQHARRVCGPYDDGLAHTPNLDALAASGTVFESAYCSSPLCIPSRASLATGRYVHELGSWDNGKPYTGVEAASWGHRLSAADRHVTCVGKLHYRDAQDPTGYADQRIPMHADELGLGSVAALLRESLPPQTAPRLQIADAGVGESEYIRYDREICRVACEWLRTESRSYSVPWVLVVSFASPHHPLVVPEEYVRHYDAAELPLPESWVPEAWPRHPALEHRRRAFGIDEPLSEAVVRRARLCYYGLVTFVDEQVGRVLDALEASGAAGETRVIYGSDHGTMLGEHGLWFKRTMYEGAVGVPLMIAGPDVAAGRRCRTTVSLVDVFPTILDAVAIDPAPEDRDLPGDSLWALATAPSGSRRVLCEYHADYSQHGEYMISDGEHKLVYYVRNRPQLFNLVDDPHELTDLAGSGAHSGVVHTLENELRRIVDPELVDARARADQAERRAALGGADALVTRTLHGFSPAPQEFREPYGANGSRSTQRGGT
jgi:choline-sulfatase